MLKKLKLNGCMKTYKTLYNKVNQLYIYTYMPSTFDLSPPHPLA